MTTKALWTLAAFHALNVLAGQQPSDTPADRHLAEAEQLFDAGNFAAAADAATRYLQEAGRAGEHYIDTLKLLDSAQEKERRRQAEQAYREWTGPQKDCASCPLMMAIPSGTFQMGSPPSEEGREDDEGPMRQVTIAEPFAIGVYEVTFAQWGACMAEGGCRHYRDWGQRNHPVVYVNWRAAMSYVQWLSRKTGKQYRLPSESEWEYAARAGTTTPFHTGSTISTDQANYNGHDTYGSGREGAYRMGTVPIGSFGANAFGLHDMHGNVGEWVQDCWNDSYAGAPSDGSAWERGDCSRRVLRGGSWIDAPRNLRSARRIRSIHRIDSSYEGLRVVRSLVP